MTARETGLDRRHACAVALALEAGALAQGMWSALGPADAKTPIDFCTEADRAVERLIRDRVTAEFGDAVIGEEYGGAAADNVWVVDPIDGTAGYIHGNGRWCISIAYVQAGQIESGVIYAPVSDRLYAARRGGGAFMNGRRMSVSHLAHGAAPVVEVGWSERRPLNDFCDVLHGLTRMGFEFRRHGSGALGLANVADGANDGYVELHINAWDALAGILLVQEAGGVVNEFLADDGLTQGNVLLAATPEIFCRIKEMVSAVQAHAVA
jgi:myo-inositol-1(or 4)-monophosphatase